MRARCAGVPRWPIPSHLGSFGRITHHSDGAALIFIISSFLRPGPVRPPLECSPQLSHTQPHCPAHRVRQALAGLREESLLASQRAISDAGEGHGGAGCFHASVGSKRWSRRLRALCVPTIVPSFAFPRRFRRFESPIGCGGVRRQALSRPAIPASSAPLQPPHASMSGDVNPEVGALRRR